MGKQLGFEESYGVRGGPVGGQRGMLLEAGLENVKRPGVCSPPGIREGCQGIWSHVDGAEDSFAPSPCVPGVTARIDPGLGLKGTSPVQLREDHVVMVRTDLTEAVHGCVVLFRDKHAVAVLLLMLHNPLSGKCPRPSHLGIMVRSANAALLAKESHPCQAFLNSSPHFPCFLGIYPVLACKSRTRSSWAMPVR